MCDCIKLANDGLKDRGFELQDVAFSNPPQIFLRTIRLPGIPWRNHKPPVILAKFCPLCGKEYKVPA